MSLTSLSLLRNKIALNVRSIVVPLAKIHTTAVRDGHQPGTGYWNQDWRPGPYPKTEDEKRAAAKKYGMIREDYEPYPDDGTGYGDYPKLPIVCADQRDSHEAYTHESLKRHYGEPIHVDVDVYGEDRFNVNERFPIPIWGQYLWFIAWMGGMWLLFQLGQQYRFQIVKKMPKQMPGDGKPHYTFDLECD